MSESPIRVGIFESQRPDFPSYGYRFFQIRAFDIRTPQGSARNCILYQILNLMSREYSHTRRLRPENRCAFIYLFSASPGLLLKPNSNLEPKRFPASTYEQAIRRSHKMVRSLPLKRTAKTQTNQQEKQTYASSAGNRKSYKSPRHPHNRCASQKITTQITQFAARPQWTEPNSGQSQPGNGQRPRVSTCRLHP